MGIKTFEVKRYSFSNYKSDSRFMVMTAWICCSNKLANDSIFTDEAIETCKDTFINMPVVAKYEQYIGDGDFKGHELELKIDKENNSKFFKYLETPIGIIPESANLRIVPDSKNPEQKWIVADILIWKERNYEISKLISRRQNIGVSMEVNFDQCHKNDKNVDVVSKFTALALTFLGKKILPAFGNSVAKLESFTEFKQAFCFALNGENQSLSNDSEDISSKENNKEVQKMDENKAMELMTAQGYSYVGFGSKAIYGMKDEKLYAIPYEVVEDNIKMSEQNFEATLYAKEEIYVKYGVDVAKEEEKVEGVAAKIDSVKVEGKSTEKFAQIEKEKADMCGKYEEMCGKYETAVKEKEEAVKDKESAIKDKEEASSKYSELEKEKKDMSDKIAEYESKLKEYKDKEFSNDIATVMCKYSLKDSEIKDWQEKSKTYSDVTTFEKDLVFGMVTTYGVVKKNDDTNKVVNFGLNKQSTIVNKNIKSDNPLDSLRQKYGI